MGRVGKKSSEKVGRVNRGVREVNMVSVQFYMFEIVREFTKAF